MDFYKEQIQYNLKMMFYWMGKATESAKQGENAMFELSQATQASGKINEYRACSDTMNLERGTETVLDWETMTADAIKQARAMIEQEKQGE